LAVDEVRETDNTLTSAQYFAILLLPFISKQTKSLPAGPAVSIKQVAMVLEVVSSSGLVQE